MPDVEDYNAHNIAEFRANGGELGGNFAGAPMLLLHTTGANTGQERVNPMMYQAVGDDYAVFASKAGAPTNPDWFHNLLAEPVDMDRLKTTMDRWRAGHTSTSRCPEPRRPTRCC